MVDYVFACVSAAVVDQFIVMLSLMLRQGARAFGRILLNQLGNLVGEAMGRCDEVLDREEHKGVLPVLVCLCFRPCLNVGSMR